MKLILIFTILLFNSILADTLPNTGLKQNEYGYYGEGVTFGGLPIVGGWRLSPNSETITIFDNNGTAGTGKWGDKIYGVNKEGTKISFFYTSYDSYSIISIGNNGCFYTEVNEYNAEISVDPIPYSTIICKTQVNNKTYGSNSNRVHITVGTGE